MKFFLTLIIFLVAGSALAANDVVQVKMFVPGDQPVQSLVSGGSFDEPIDFVVEPLITDSPSNVLRAQKEIWFYCVINGNRTPDCVITLTWEARADNAGHIHSHVGTRPKGRFSRTTGQVDQSDWYFKTVYYSSEVSGIIDVTINCNSCTTLGQAKIGVGITGLVELPEPASADSGYTLTGANQYHPFNHFGQSNFVYSVLQAFYDFHNPIPASDTPRPAIKANDTSLELGGVFDVQTPRFDGYDWTPPHRYHRLGQSMDTSFPTTKSGQRAYEAAMNLNGIDVLKEDAFHWHLHVGGHL